MNIFVVTLTPLAVDPTATAFKRANAQHADYYRALIPAG